MYIRCEKCSTTYELDEKLLAPEGSPVQCTKCQHVFTAVPPRSPGRTLVGVPAAPPPAPVPAPRAHVPEPPVSAAGAARQGPAIYKRPPSPSPSSSVVRSPHAKRDTMGAFEARLRASARLRWIVPLAVAGVLVLAVAGWLLFSGGVDPAIARRHAEAMALVAQDDIASLEKAGQQLDELSRQRTGLEAVDADRALAQILLATGLAEDVSTQAARLAAKVAERDRLAAIQPPPEGLAALSAEIEGLRGQVEPRQTRAKTLTDQAYAALKQLSGEHEGEVAVARALAIHFAASGDRDQALRFIRAVPGAADRDPWVRLAEGWLDAREEGKEPRERGVAKLAALVAAHPEVVRARYLLAKTQAALGKREQAAATLDGLLAANPNHQRARRFREELVAGAGAQPAPVPPAAPVAPGAPRGPALPLTQRPAGAAAPAPVGPPVTAAPPPGQRPVPSAAVPPPGGAIVPRPPAPVAPQPPAGAPVAAPVAAPKPSIPAPGPVPVKPAATPVAPAVSPPKPAPAPAAAPAPAPQPPKPAAAAPSP